MLSKYKKLKRNVMIGNTSPAHLLSCLEKYTCNKITPTINTKPIKIFIFHLSLSDYFFLFLHQQLVLFFNTPFNISPLSFCTINRFIIYWSSALLIHIEIIKCFPTLIDIILISIYMCIL